MMRGWLCLLVFMVTLPVWAQTNAAVFGASSGDAITAENTESLVQIARFGGGSAQAMAWSPDGKLLAVGGSVGVWLYNAEDLSEEPQLFVGHTAPVYSIVFSPDGSSLASGGGDSTVRVWDVAEGELTQTLEVPYSAAFRSVAWDGTANLVIGATDLGEILLWNAETGDFVASLTGQPSITNMAFSPQTPVLGAASLDGTIFYWNVVNQENIQTMPAAGSGIVDFAWSADGAQLARVDETGGVQLMDAVSNALLQQLPPAQNRVLEIAYAPSGTAIAVGDVAGTINLLDATSLETLTSWTVPAAVVEMAYQPDGNLLAVLTTEGMYLWDGSEIVASLAQVYRSGSAVQAVFDANGHIAISYSGSTANVLQYDLESGAVLTSGDLFGQEVRPYQRLVYSPDSTILAVNDSFGIALLNSETGEQQGYLDTVGTIVSFVFAPDGSLIVTGDSGGVLQVWDAASGQALATYQDHTAGINHVVFNADGTLLLSASEDGTVRVYAIGQ